MIASSIQADPKDLALLKTLLRVHLPAVSFRAYVFGSRARGNARANSDLDLWIETEAQIPPEQISSLRAALEESDLPFKVDLVEGRDASPDFREHVEDEFKLLL